MAVVYFPKQVGIENHRLFVAWWVMNIVGMVLCCVDLFYEKAYFSEEEADDIVLIVWAAVGSNTTGMDYDVDEEMCSNLDRYDYCFDTACVYGFFNNTCMDPCDDGYMLTDCANWWELRRDSMSRDQVMVSTHIKQQYFQSHPNGTTENLDTTVHLMRGSHRWKIEFKYSETVPKNGYTFYSSETSSSTDEILTVLCDPKGNVIGTYEPDESISLVWNEIASATGYTGLLDVAMPEAGANMLEGAYYSSGPAARVTGVEVDLTINCVNVQSELLYDVQVSWGGPVCVVTCLLADVPKTWPTYVYSFRSPDSNITRLRRFHGINVVADTGGVYYYFHWYNIYSWFILSSVVLRVPSTITCIMASRFCGHLSKVYGRAIRERFNLATQIASGPMDVMINAQIFDNIVGSEEIELKKDAFIMWMARGLKGYLGADLDHQELCNMIDMSYHQMLVLMHAKRKEVSKSQLGEKKKRSLFKWSHKEQLDAAVFEHDDATGIDRDGFLQLSLLKSAVSIPDMVVLFDRDRHVSRAERFFRPYELKSVLTSGAASAAHIVLADAAIASEQAFETQIEGGGAVEKGHVLRRPSDAAATAAAANAAVAAGAAANEATCSELRRLQEKLEELRMSTDSALYGVSEGMKKTDHAVHSLTQGVKKLAQLELLRLQVSTPATADGPPTGDVSGPKADSGSLTAFLEMTLPSQRLDVERRLDALEQKVQNIFNDLRLLEPPPLEPPGANPSLTDACSAAFFAMQSAPGRGTTATGGGASLVDSLPNAPLPDQLAGTAGRDSDNGPGSPSLGGPNLLFSGGMGVESVETSARRLQEGNALRSAARSLPTCEQPDTVAPALCNEAEEWSMRC
eukprot:NODE_507_length_2981_cov_7.467765.p1 GENE.NODE_507_length_2981_cov_7.467765~~NODE_507_length_2981_cov_7.467765.p1  ORF type:complete len:855 (+),score=194.87 NODE_507_length_2981_cov_7.467765:110-2674(+)